LEANRRGTEKAMSDEDEKIITSLDRTRRIEIFKAPASNLFRFVELRLEYDEYGGLEFWHPIYESGLYASTEEAEQAAYLETRWMRKDLN